MCSNGSHSQQCGYRFLHYSLEKVYSSAIYSVEKVYISIVFSTEKSFIPTYLITISD